MRTLLVQLIVLCCVPGRAQNGFRAANVSPTNAWLGATLAFNVEENPSADDVVGATRVSIAPVEELKGKFRLHVIGNVGKITDRTADSLSSSFESLMQTAQGLSIGISPIYRHTLSKDSARNNTLAGFMTFNYRANRFRLGEEEEAVERLLSQARVTAGVEFEGLKVKEGGTFSLTVEGFTSVFDASIYEEIYGEERSSIIGCEATLIIPLSGLFGFLIGATYSDADVPIYQTGLIISGDTQR